VKKYIHIIILGILLALLVIVEYFAPKPIDWKPSFKKQDKIPYGAYITFDLLQDAFPKSKIEENYKSLYLKLNAKEFQNTTYISITDQFTPGHASLLALFSFVEKGNKAFIAAEAFENEFCDSLKLKINLFFKNELVGDSSPYYFANPYLKSDSAYWIKSPWMSSYFESIDTINSRAIATIDKDKLDFIKIPYGKGEFFIHNQPYAFTNYNLLFKNNAEYAFKTFSYLKNDIIIWDENYKPGRESSSPLAYILDQDSLKAAWYMILTLGLLFMIFGAKRTQRIIPVVTPPENSSLEFAKTLGNLYLSNRNHKDIAKKKYNYWLDFLRENYFIHIENPDELDVVKISEKTGVNVEKIMKIKKYIDNSGNIGADLLMKFNQLIEEFYRERK
jgi:hypothetical protein